MKPQIPTFSDNVKSACEIADATARPVETVLMEQIQLVPNARYEIFTPLGNEDAAQKLYELFSSEDAEADAL